MGLSGREGFLPQKQKSLAMPLGMPGFLHFITIQVILERQSTVPYLSMVGHWNANHTK
jgi:hypothetical protein